MKKRLSYAVLCTLLCSLAHASDAPKTPPVAPITPPAPATTPVINCDYPIAASITTIDESVLKMWAEKAALQTFDFTPADIDAQLLKLKPCFTDQGWLGFNDAINKSGNIKAIKTQSLNVSGQKTGEIKIDKVKENQWKVTLPIQVVYQNSKERLTQNLSVEMLIGRKQSGNLGMMQIIAVPQDTNPNSTGQPMNKSKDAA